MENYSNRHPFETYKSLINNEARATGAKVAKNYNSVLSNYEHIDFKKRCKYMNF